MLANVLGSISVAYLVFVWLIVLNPLKWNLAFPGGVTAGFFTLLLNVVVAILAGIFGKRAWLILTGASTVTFIYLGFFYRLPMLY